MYFVSGNQLLQENKGKWLGEDYGPDLFNAQMPQRPTFPG